MLSLRFSGSKFLVDLRWQFRVRKNFFTQVLAGFAVFSLFKITISKMRNLCSRLLFHQNFNRLLTSVFVLVDRMLVIRSNGLMIKFLMNK